MKTTIIFLAAFLLTHLPAANLSAKDPRALITPSQKFFSPNRDGIQESVDFTFQIDSPKNIVQWDLVVKDSQGKIRKNFSGAELPPESLNWMGVDEYGAPCPEGNYDIFARVYDKKNQFFESPPVRVTLDTTPPILSFSSPVRRVSAKGPAITPVPFYLSAVDLSGIRFWKIEIHDEQYRTVYVDSSTANLPPNWTYFGDALPPSSNKITAQLHVVDGSGNRNVSTPIEFEIVKSQAASEDPAQEPAAKSPAKKVEGLLQMTVILSMSDLFGASANPASGLAQEAATLLNPVAKILQDNPGVRATILGHVDQQENNDQAKTLSSAYAWKVYSFLVKERSANKDVLSVKGLGAEVPIADNQSSIGRSRNRRIEFQIFLPAAVQ